MLQTSETQDHPYAAVWSLSEKSRRPVALYGWLSAIGFLIAMVVALPGVLLSFQDTIQTMLGMGIDDVVVAGNPIDLSLVTYWSLGIGLAISFVAVMLLVHAVRNRRLNQ